MIILLFSIRLSFLGSLLQLSLASSLSRLCPYIAFTLLNQCIYAFELLRNSDYVLELKNTKSSYSIQS